MEATSISPKEKSPLKRRDFPTCRSNLPSHAELRGDAACIHSTTFERANGIQHIMHVFYLKFKLSFELASFPGWLVSSADSNKQTLVRTIETPTAPPTAPQSGDH
jgi:hypothetical protein